MRLQRTIRESGQILGLGVHSGEECCLKFKPLPENSGIVFCRKDLAEEMTWVVGQPGFETPLNGDLRQTTLGSDTGSIKTIEHLMAALWALGICNLSIEVMGGEIPILDGSSLDFINAFNDMGIIDQTVTKPEFVLKEPLFVSGKQSAILALPSAGFSITYTLDYPHPQLKAMTLAININPEEFIEKIAPARTFCTKDEAQQLLDLGYGKGANTNNTLVLAEDGPIENVLRFDNEPVRHKILDLVGDLSLLGYDFKAQIIAIRSGHALNHALRAKILKTSQLQAN
ncbi:MAG: UDP-3-O-[3-hydroxymyristoyl] N-acetylglucosamine deacetylase [Candidatus Omnitrophota bacterium]|jgi:UDP-3-O-[3-hydroxymyristoyl] N-acetylglucosamine deacetylase